MVWVVVLRVLMNFSPASLRLLPPWSSPGCRHFLVHAGWRGVGVVGGAAETRMDHHRSLAQRRGVGRKPVLFCARRQHSAQHGGVAAVVRRQRAGVAASEWLLLVAMVGTRWAHDGCGAQVPDFEMSISDNREIGPWLRLLLIRCLRPDRCVPTRSCCNCGCR